MPLKVLDSPFREITGPVIEYVRSVRRGSPRDVVTVLIPEYVVGHWWEHLLHNQSALRLKGRLLFTPGVMVTSVPWQLKSSEALADRVEGSAPGAVRRGDVGRGRRPVLSADETPVSAVGRRRSSSRSARSPTAGTASPGTRAGWCSSGTRCRASGCASASPTATTARSSGAPTPSRCSSRRRTASRRRARGPGRAGAAAATGSTPSLPAQRALKAAVVREQLQPAGRPRASTSMVEAVPGDDDGLGWRTRVQSPVDDDGRAGLRRHRSHEVVPVDHCLIAHPLTSTPPGSPGGRWPGVASVEVAVSTTRRRDRWCCRTAAVPVR